MNTSILCTSIVSIYPCNKIIEFINCYSHYYRPNGSKSRWHYQTGWQNYIIYGVSVKQTIVCLNKHFVGNINYIVLTSILPAPKPPPHSLCTNILAQFLWLEIWFTIIKYKLYDLHWWIWRRVARRFVHGRWHHMWYSDRQGDRFHWDGRGRNHSENHGTKTDMLEQSAQTWPPPCTWFSHFSAFKLVLQCIIILHDIAQKVTIHFVCINLR